ncbi:MAG: hypothetical protein B7733_15995 [Myxococcales bacterium FL481]|nr:MAG: hypothetical protein B7733_15995 [Myxococcales bacterium FL481]
MHGLDFVGQRPPWVARVCAGEGGVVELRSPAVGLWCDPPPPGAYLTPGAVLGELDILGRRTRLVVPPGVDGVVVSVDTHRVPSAQVPVEFDQLLLSVNRQAARGTAATEATATLTDVGANGLVFRAPSSGRFYSRARPESPPFVAPETVVARGDTVGLLEVMKTFTRLIYQGTELPERAVVRRVVPQDDSDLEAGDVILELAAVGDADA